MTQINRAFEHHSKLLDNMDWGALARVVVHECAQVERGERVVFTGDPYLYRRTFDAFRVAVQDAGGIELGTLMGWTEPVAGRRNKLGRNPDAALEKMEREARLELFRVADVYLCLPDNPFIPGSNTLFETEWILGRWRGRGVHFHWWPDFYAPFDDPIHARVYDVTQKAVLDLDYGALLTRQEHLVELITGATIHITSPTGTDLILKFPNPGWYHINAGRADRGRGLAASCARDREEEMPAGAVRSLPVASSVEGQVVFQGRPISFPGFGLDWEPFAEGLRLRFVQGHLAELRTGDRELTIKLTAEWENLDGDKDRLSEVIFGTNPLLLDPEGITAPVAGGSGEGIVRLNLGDNTESGGVFQSPLLSRLFLRNCTVSANGVNFIEDGRLLF